MTAELNLNCLVFEGGDKAPENHVFTIRIATRDNVSVLKRRIKQQQAVEGVDAYRFIIWKPKDRIVADVGLKEALRGKPFADGRFEQLLPVRRLGSIFDSPLDEGELNVLVQIPDTLKRGHSPSFGDTRRLWTNDHLQDGWLFELHSNIWNHRHLAPDLFYEVEITAAHYVELQKRLENLYPNRASEDYWNSDVISIKLDVLQSRAPPEALMQVAHRGNDEDGDKQDSYGMDDELRAFFPAKITYMDLSSLKLKKPPPRIPVPLLIRQEYYAITNLLNKLPEGDAGSAIVSGQPGTGKTAYLHLQIIRSMIEGVPFLYQTIQGDVYHVDDSITLIQSYSPEEHIVAYVDADTASYAPNNILINRLIQIVLASSPKGTKQRWMSQYSRLVKTYISDLWSPGELFLTGLFLNPQDLTYARLKESVSYFGFNPRRCFQASSSTSNLIQLQQDLEERVRFIPPTVEISTIFAEAYSSSGLSHSIFELSPGDDKRLLGGARVGAVSMWALDLLLKKYESRQSDAAFNFYHSIMGIRSAATLRGNMMERQVLKYFDSLDCPQTFEIRSLADSTISNWTYPGPVKRASFQSSSFTSLLSSAVSSGQALHLVPLDPNFPAIDSVLYDTSSSVLTGIQVTIRDEHPMAVSGLKRIQGWLRQQSTLDHLQPSIPYNHWRLVFVIPEPAAASFEQQPMEGDTRGNEWAGKVDQYVLGLQEDTLWKRTATTGHSYVMT